MKSNELTKRHYILILQKEYVLVQKIIYPTKNELFKIPSLECLLPYCVKLFDTKENNEKYDMEVIL